MADSFLFSGEPLPLAPNITGLVEDDNDRGKASEVELEVFHRKLLDYIRRLGAKLDNPVFPPGGGSTSANLAMFSARMESNYSPSTTSYEGIPWDQETRKDTDTFAHDSGTDPHQITLLQEGFYVFLIDIGTTSGGNSDVRTRLVETTLGVVEHSQATLKVQHGVSEVGYHHSPYTCGINAAAGSVFVYEAFNNAGAIEFKFTRTRITIILLTARGDTVFPTVPGCDGPFDCFYEI